MMKRQTDKADRLGDEDGYMLIELIISAVLVVGIVGMLAYLLVIAGRNEPDIRERSVQVQEGRVAVEKMIRDIREGYVVNGTPTTTQISVNTFVRHTSCGATATLADSAQAIACRVTFTCASGTCTRVEANTNGSSPGSPVTVVSGLASNDVFTHQVGASGQAYVGVRLVFPGESGEESVTVADGAELRNE